MRMHDCPYQQDMDLWLSDIREKFVGTAPHLLSLFDIYAAEALFGRRYISPDLAALRAGAKILEVGAGSFLLCMQLAREGYVVTALEPVGSGFSHFNEMRKIILKEDEAQKLVTLDIPVEHLDCDNCFDYAYSVNVLEHVDDVELAVRNVGKSLVVGAHFRFTCPNYLFPYEPHFNIPTLFSKRLTGWLFGKKIFGNNTMPDPVGTWKSLNWITVMQVVRVVQRQPELHLMFNRSMLASTLERIATDAQFATRRSPLVRNLIRLSIGMRAHKLIQILPALLHPIMDCDITKTISRKV